MHNQVLNKKQEKLLSIVKKFSDNFGLVGGTAMALQIGHRHSIDFDLFTNTKFHNSHIRKIITANHKKIQHVYVDSTEEFSVLVDGVRFAFSYYPFKIKFTEKLEDIIKLPDILTLSSMKAYALGRRAKWKDYVDLYFVLSKYHQLDQIIKKSKQIFETEFNEKIFRSQLIYFKDIDYTEKVDYLKGFKISDKHIKEKLTEFTL